MNSKLTPGVEHPVGFLMYCDIFPSSQHQPASDVKENSDFWLLLSTQEYKIYRLISKNQ